VFDSLTGGCILIGYLLRLRSFYLLRRKLELFWAMKLRFPVTVSPFTVQTKKHYTSVLMKRYYRIICTEIELLIGPSSLYNALRPSDSQIRPNQIAVYSNSVRCVHASIASGSGIPSLDSSKPKRRSVLTGSRQRVNRHNIGCMNRMTIVLPLLCNVCMICLVYRLARKTCANTLRDNESKVNPIAARLWILSLYSTVE